MKLELCFGVYIQVEVVAGARVRFAGRELTGEESLDNPFIQLLPPSVGSAPAPAVLHSQVEQCPEGSTVYSKNAPGSSSEKSTTQQDSRREQS